MHVTLGEGFFVKTNNKQNIPFSHREKGYPPERIVRPARQRSGGYGRGDEGKQPHQTGCILASMLNHLLRTTQKTIDRARLLRKTQLTTPEKLLWEELRDRRLHSLKFRRQVPLGPFIADFFCPEAHLIIELDGDSHEGKKEYDARRTRFLEEHSYHVLRFSNEEVIESIEGVLQKIVECVEAWEKQFER